MTAVRYGWLGVTRRQAIVEKLDRLIGDWIGEWCMQAGVGEPRAQIATEWPHGANLATVRCARSAAGQSACHVRGLRHGALGRWLMDIQDEDGVGLAEALAWESLADLSRRIHADAMGSGPVAMSETDIPMNPDAFRAWTGALHAQVQLGRVELDVLLDRDLCARMAPPPATARRTLTPRASALTDVKLRLDAVLDFGSASLTDLSNLQVGELLVSDMPLTTLVSFGSGDGKVLASGQLSRAGDRLALRMHTTQE
jgi:hypothetical protein